MINKPKKEPARIATQSVAGRWEKKFDEKFLWEVRPVGVKKGDKDQEEYVLGMPMLDWNDDTTLNDIKQFISTLLSQQAEEIIGEIEKMPIDHHFEDQDDYELGYVNAKDDIITKIKSFMKGK